MLAGGATCGAIQHAVWCGRAYMARWRTRFEAGELRGLFSSYQAVPRCVLTVRMEAQILERTRAKPKDGSTHRTTHKLPKELGIHHMAV
jgi:hypothetical protein